MAASASFKKKVADYLLSAQSVSNETYEPVTIEGMNVVSVIGGVWKWGPLFSQQASKAALKTA